jgi:hypothetical protein
MLARPGALACSLNPQSEGEPVNAQENVTLDTTGGGVGLGDGAGVGDGEGVGLGEGAGLGGGAGSGEPVGIPLPPHAVRTLATTSASSGAISRFMQPWCGNDGWSSAGWSFRQPSEIGD